MVDREDVERTAAAARAGGDDWYGRHIDAFRQAILRPDLRPQDVAYYDAAIAAKAGEQVLTGLRIAVREAAKEISQGVPAEPQRDAGERIVQSVREVVLREDADPKNVAAYESMVAANSFRPFAAETQRAVADAAREAGAL